MPSVNKSSGGNFAPLKPLLRLRDKSVPLPEHPIQKAMAERFQHYHRKDSDVWREIYGVMQLTARFISGDQILIRNPVSGGYDILPIAPSTTTPRSINYMQFYANMLSAKDLQSNPDVLISAGRNKDQCISAARARMPSRSTITMSGTRLTLPEINPYLRSRVGRTLDG
jgi:hypothetical protein